MAKQTDRDQIPAGFVYCNEVLVPEAVQKAVLQRAVELRREHHEAERRAEAAIEGAAFAEVAITEVRDAKPTRNLVKVYATEVVKRYAQQLDSLNSSHDRRRTAQALVKTLLERNPVGYRACMPVPRNYLQRLHQLEVEMPNFHQAIGHLRLALTLQRAGDRRLRIPPLLLAGDPGVGKTYFAMRFAQAMGMPWRVVNMETATTGTALAGTELHWSTGGPGAIFDELVKGPQANPLIIVDELDKASTTYRPTAALYQLLEPGTAVQFRDNAIPEIPLDASHVNWLLTANDLSRVDAPLLNRMQIVHVPEPTRRQRIYITALVYRDLKRSNHWGRHFDADLPGKSAKFLAEVPGSVRRLRAVLSGAFAQALERKSRLIEIRDLEAVLFAELPLFDLESAEPQGRA